MAALNMLNFNVGILGHVDSGKTALAKAVSTVASTASFDKNPQSQERGITLDLGFSSFCVDIPEHIKRDDEKLQTLQFTFVDCPGHASLIKTVIGGAQVIDLMLLVIDVTKGMQTQTAECLVIGQITCEKMIVVLNKVDLLPEATRQTTVEKMTKKMLKTLDNTRFAHCPVVAVAAKPGGPEAPDSVAIGIDKLVDTLKTCSFLPKRETSGPFTYAVDHCFLIRGQGTIMTGTVLSGSVAVGDAIEIAAMKVTKKVKSMQVFRKPVNQAVQGDRVGICVTQFDPKQLERGLVCAPGALSLIHAAIIAVEKVDYFRGVISTKAKFHITIGHETVMARVSFFGLHKGVGDIEKLSLDDANKFDFTHEYVYQEELIPTSVKSDKSAGHCDTESLAVPVRQFALLQFEQQVICPHGCLVIGSKLDTDIHANVCRLAFHGKLLELVFDPDYVETLLPQVRVYKIKHKEGIVERKADDYTVVCRGLFKKESKVEMFTGLKVKLSTGEDGVIEGSFGQSGKFKVRLPGGLSNTTSQLLATKGKKNRAKGEAAPSQDSVPTESIKILLTFKRYMYDPKKEMIQT